MKKYIVFLTSFFLLISYSLSFAERGAIKNIDSSGTDYYATTIEWPAGVTITDDGNRKISIDISSSLSGTDGRIVVFSDSNSGENSLMNQSDSNTVALDSGAHFETDEIRAVDPNNGVKVYSGGAGIFVDNTGNVGIGTTSPIVRTGFTAPWLTISSASPGMAFVDINSANSNRYIATNAGYMDFGKMNDDGTSPSSHMYISISGNVGIGTTGPNAELEISSTSPELSISNTTDTDNGTRATDVVFYGTNGSLFEQGRISCYHDSNNDDKDGAIKFLTNDGSDADGALTERMVIDNNGNVGIGTTAPGAKLDIVGANDAINLRMADIITDATGKESRIASGHYTNAEEPLAIIGSASGSTSGLVLVGGGYANENAATQIDFYTATNNTTVTGTSRMTINNSGNVGIGTTAPIGNVQISSTNAHGGYVTKIYEASSGTLTGATDTIELAIPSGWRILQCQLHVKTAVTDDAGDDTWSSELNDGGTEETISAGSAAAQNTNVNHWADADTWGTLTDAETDILLTPNGGNFSAGEIEAHCLCQGFDNWDNE